MFVVSIFLSWAALEMLKKKKSDFGFDFNFTLRPPSVYCTFFLLESNS